MGKSNPGDAFMRIFVTGASGFIGSAVVAELISAGHSVLGLARSDASADKVAAAGADVQRGSLDDLESLKSGAAATDGVIHLGFIHDFSDFKRNCAIDRSAIEALGGALAGSSASPPRHLRRRDQGGGTDRHRGRPGHSGDRRLSPRFGSRRPSRSPSAGLSASTVRLPPSVHGLGDKGFIPMLYAIARQKGVSAYVGEGLNRWPAVHRFDAARVFRLAIERGAVGGPFHAMGDEGIPLREIATAIGRRLNVPVVSVKPEEAQSHFGWFGGFAGWDVPTSSARTRALLNWTPNQPGLLADMDQPDYFGG